MKYVLLIAAITAFFMADVYHDGKYTQMLKSGKKYYQMAGIAFAGISAYALFKKDPAGVHGLVSSANGVLRNMPLDHEAGEIFAPMFRQMAQSQYGNNAQPQSQYGNNAQNRLLQSGKQGTKRSVSETKKKFVAANQTWKCGSCRQTLPAWFEVDHKIRLDQGGSNHVDNLVALCRDCHGRKTACENL
jgi:hypothetical protein